MERRAEIIGWIKDILDQNMSGMFYSAFIFGSQANSHILKRADIDIGIRSEYKIADSRLAEIADAIAQLPMLYNVDLVDFNSVESGFKEVALKDIEII